jgi:8-amino-7-oxononanoate synthase
LDFTSALYLGLKHGSAQMLPWGQLTTGRPAALGEPPAAKQVAAGLAALMGCEAAILAPSTLHLFWDLFGFLSTAPIAVYFDAGSYPIARWGGERAMVRGVPVRRYPRHDEASLRRCIEADEALGLQPVVVADGYSPGLGRSAPVTAYLEAVRARGGYLILDDTQALGILGSNSGPQAPFGLGGGGTVRRSGVGGSAIVVVASLAKGLGVPIAVMAGSGVFVRAFKEHSATRLHCSPPSIASIHAAQHALDVNGTIGDLLRQRLALSVKRFRRRLAEIGLGVQGELFPVLTLSSIVGRAALMLHESLLCRGVCTVLHRPRGVEGARLSFLVTVDHRPEEIDLAVESVAASLGMTQVHWR